MKQSLRLLIIICAAILPFLCVGCTKEIAQKEKEQENKPIEEKRTVELRDPVKDYHSLREKLKNATYDYNGGPAGKENCMQFLNDFIENKNIAIIEPIIQTNDYDDSRLKPYFDKCPNLKEELNVVYIDGVKFYYSHYDYRLYDIDFDNNPENKVHNVFFAAGYYTETIGIKRIDFADLHHFVDFNNCKRIVAEGAGRLYDSDTLQHRNHYSGIALYNEKYFIYETNVFYKKDLTGEESPNRLGFTTWNHKTNRRSECCYYYKKEDK